jgi:hypothetical protein
MIDLSSDEIIEYWRRSHDTADGLWFMKVEEKYGFDAALDIDDQVWTVLPKIKARMLKSMGGLENGISGLFEAVVTKLHLEGFTFEARMADEGTAFKVIITDCPWHHVMIKSGREHLSAKVGVRIDTTEYAAWAAEFGDGLAIEFGDRICEGCRTCVFKFTSVPETAPSPES